jgi:hypothetical protein
LSRDDARITHHIAPDVDADRDLLTKNLAAAKLVTTIYEVTGVGPTLIGRNGEGDLYFTDGDIKISVLVEGCNQRSESVAELSNPPLVAAKNLAWDTIAKTVLAGTAAPVNQGD